MVSRLGNRVEVKDFCQLQCLDFMRMAADVGTGREREIDVGEWTGVRVREDVVDVRCRLLC